MPCIKPVSDLRNYNEVLQNVSEDSPVFLTKNGRGSYAIITIDEYEKLNATIKLLSELAKGEKYAKEKG
jgi:prevent-host-death family protein